MKEIQIMGLVCQENATAAKMAVAKNFEGGKRVGG